MSKLQYYQNDDLNEIIKGFEMFDVENKGQIDPLELKETMEEMNLIDKNPFIYELISSLCSLKDIKTKGGLTPEEFISFLQEKINDVESQEGIKRIFDVFSDLDNKIPMPTFYKTAREVGDEEGSLEIRDLVEKSKTGGKELDFDEFYEIMKDNNYNQYSYKYISNNKEINNSKKEYIVEKEYSYKKKSSPTIQKSGLIIVDKIVTEQVDDSPVKISRYHYKYDKDGTVKDSEENKTILKDLNLDENKDAKSESSTDQRFHSRYRESKITTEKIYQTNTGNKISYTNNSNIVPINNTNLVYTKYKKKKNN